MPTANIAEWYAAESGEEAAARLSAVVRHIRDRSGWRRQADQLHAELYAGGPGAMGLFASSRIAYDYAPAAFPRNVCRSAVDTLQAKVAKHRPLPQCLTSKGNWKDQKRARKMSQFLEGEFHQQKIYERKAKLIVRDAGVFGRAFLFVCDVGKRIVTERIPPWEIFFDPWDARYGEPRNIYRVQTVDRGVLKARFGKKRDGDSADDVKRRMQALEDGSVGRADDWDWDVEADATVDRVRIVSGWHLCDDDEAHASLEPAEHECTGRFMVSILGGIDLVDEVWSDDAFPIAQLNFADPLSGCEGQGACEMLAGWQAAINEQFDRTQEGHHMLGGGMILVPLGSDIVDTSFHNGVVPIIKHQPGKPPQFVTPAPVNPAVYQRERDMPVDALNELGLSQQSSMAIKTPGVEAGIAIQTLDDIETERHVIFGRSYEAWNLDVARLLIKSASRIAKRHGDYAISVPMKGGLLDLSWKEVSLKHFQVRVFPTSLLPQQMAGRLEKLKMLFDGQLIDRATFLQQLDAPDLGAELDMETADRLNIDEKLESILEADADDINKVYKPPTAYQSIDWAVKRAQQKLNKAETDGAPSENLDALRRFISDGLAEQQKKNQPQDLGAAFMPQPGQPLAPPGAPATPMVPPPPPPSGPPGAPPPAGPPPPMMPPGPGAMAA